MGRARLLACAAVAMAAAALPTTAKAQGCWLVGSPQPVPPCIVFDGKKILEAVEEVRQKAAELQARKDELAQYANIEKVMGAVGPRNIPSFPSLPAIAPLAEKTFGQAGTEARARIGSGAADTEGMNEERRRAALDLRAAAGDGYSIALATKTRFDEMKKDADSISTLAAKCSVDARSDWSFNTQARSLLLRAIAARREIDAAQVQLMSAKVLASSTMTSSGPVQTIPQAQPAAVPPPVVGPAWSDGLGRIANLTQYLAALITAKDLLSDFRNSLRDHQETQQEYQQVLAAANRAQANMVAYANDEGRRKRVSGAALLAEADRVMASMDRTTWDDPSKTSVANTAAKAAKARLDRIVDGDVQSGWIKNLANRAEAFKQEAFYRQFDAEAKSMQADAAAAIAEYGKQININLDDPRALDAAIAATQNNLSLIGKQMDSAPENVRLQRDAIYQSTMETAGFPEANGQTRPM